MRAKRVHALFEGYGKGFDSGHDGHRVLSGAERRAIKKEYRREIDAKAQGWDRPAKERRRRKPVKVKFRGVGNPKREWEFGPPVEARPLRRIDFYAELSDKGKERAQKLMFGLFRTVADKHFKRRLPIPGTGSASRIPKPELLRRIAALRVHIGVQQFDRFGK